MGSCERIDKGGGANSVSEPTAWIHKNLNTKKRESGDREQLAPQVHWCVYLTSAELEAGVEISKNTRCCLPVSWRGKALRPRLPSGGHVEDVSQGMGSPEHQVPCDARLGLGQVLRGGCRQSWEAKLLFTCQVPRDRAHRGHHYETGKLRAWKERSSPQEVSSLGRGPEGAGFWGSH